MRTTLMAASVLLALVACGEKNGNGNQDKQVDSDGDGLFDDEEADLGTDPDLADTDGDGLSDGEELDHGTDPLSLDSDDDTYWDSWEITEGTDPNDAESRIYTGYWPYQPDKDSFNAPDISEVEGEKGEKLARVVYMDQWGDMVDIYDFAGDGRPMAIDISAIWCGPCHAMAGWISGQSDDYGFNDYWPSVPEAVHNGDVIWVTVLGQNNQGNQPNEAQLYSWYEDYPDDKVPVLSDDGNFYGTYLGSGWPTVFLVDTTDMSITMMPRNYTKVLDELEAQFGGQ